MIGTAALTERAKAGFRHEPVQQTIVDQFLASVPATATPEQKQGMAARFAHMVRSGGPYPIQGGIKMAPATAAAIADALEQPVR